MIKNVKVRGNKVSFECSLEERNSLFYKGLQILADEQFGESKVVVIPCKSKVGKLAKSTYKNAERFEVSDQFVEECINVMVNRYFKIFLDELEAEYDLTDSKAKKRATKSKPKKV